MSKRPASRAVINPVTRFLAQLPDLRGRRVLLGLSGGADSVALSHALAALQRKFQFGLTAAHLNHALRGAESDRDESFVRELCTRLGVELMVERARGWGDRRAIWKRERVPPAIGFWMRRRSVSERIMSRWPIKPTIRRKPC